MEVGFAGTIWVAGMVRSTGDLLLYGAPPTTTTTTVAVMVAAAVNRSLRKILTAARNARAESALSGK